MNTDTPEGTPATTNGQTADPKTQTEPSTTNTNPEPLEGSNTNEPPKPVDVPPYEFNYIKILEENDLDLKSLPLRIRNKTKPIPKALEEYEKTGTKESHEELVKLDYILVNLIMKHIDSNLPDTSVNNPANPTPAPANKNTEPPKPESPKQPEPPKPASPKPEPPKKENPQKKMEDLVLQKIEENPSNVISTSDLFDIVGKFDDDKIVVNNIVLKKVFLRQEFRRIK